MVFRGRRNREHSRTFIAVRLTAKSRSRGVNRKAAAGLRISDGSSTAGATKRLCFYFSEVLIEVNFALRLVPRPLTAAIIAIEMPAAIRPYSMAVAADSSFRKRVKSLDMSNPV
jgi:hypothetical protein